MTPTIARGALRLQEAARGRGRGRGRRVYHRDRLGRFASRGGGLASRGRRALDYATSPRGKRALAAGAAAAGYALAYRQRKRIAAGLAGAAIGSAVGTAEGFAREPANFVRKARKGAVAGDWAARQAGASTPLRYGAAVAGGTTRAAGSAVLWPDRVGEQSAKRAAQGFATGWSASKRRRR